MSAHTALPSVPEQIASPAIDHELSSARQTSGLSLRPSKFPFHPAANFKELRRQAAQRIDHDTTLVRHPLQANSRHLHFTQAQSRRHISAMTAPSFWWALTGGVMAAAGE